MDVTSILSSVLTGGTGGIIGVVGNVANTFMALKQQSQEHEFQIKMMPLQTAAKQAEALAAIEQTKADVAKVVEQGAADAFTASQRADTITGKEDSWVLDVKALVRPTCLLLLGAGTLHSIYLVRPQLICARTLCKTLCVTSQWRSHGTLVHVHQPM